MSLRIGIWNIDHAEAGARRQSKKAKRFDGVMAYLVEQRCDIYFIAEANAAIHLDGYEAQFSDESVFLKKGRSYSPPNLYHQAAIYSRTALDRMPVDEPLNGVHCTTMIAGTRVHLYSGVITVKDRYKKDSPKKYGDRLQEQLGQLSQLQSQNFIAGGDFNLRKSWAPTANAHSCIKELVGENGWIWPTESEESTVQHVVHSSDFAATYTIDASVRADQDGRCALSDHPFMLVQLNPAD